MKPIIVTALDGTTRPRLNPNFVIGWGAAILQPPAGGPTHLGARIALADGTQREVLESAEQLDWLFQAATAVSTGDRPVGRMPETASAGSAEA